MFDAGSLASSDLSRRAATKYKTFKSNMIDWFGFEAEKNEREAIAFYGPAYFAIKKSEQDRQQFEKVRIQTANSRIDEVAHQVGRKTQVG